MPTLVTAFGISLVALGYFYGYARAFIGLVMAGVVAWIGFNYFRSVGEIPPEPEETDLRRSDYRYVCSVCGLELKVETGALDKAPSHCREKMELVTAGGGPPLRSV